jgi:glycosyltransferase involved in cell wall biosynthesis
LLGGDIFVLASHAEPAGLVLSEAREAGCAILGTHVGGIPEMLDQGRAGILVPPSRPDLLAAALLPLLQNPGELAQARENSQINIENLALSRVARQTEQVYRELLGQA